MSQTLTDGDYTATAQALGLDDTTQDTQPLSDNWIFLDGDDLGSAVIERFRRFRSFQNSNGIIRAMRLKTNYYHNTYRASFSDMPHLAVMQQFGTAGEFSFVSLNIFRSLIKTLLASVIQNPPAYTVRAVNSDADAMESAALYQGVLDYYTRELRITSKINRAVEMAMVLDQSYILTEWDYFSLNGVAPQGSNIWAGAPSVKVLSPWDVAYDITAGSWGELEYVICRDWISKEKLRMQFPERSDDIDGLRLRCEVIASDQQENNIRYEVTGYPELSDAVQLFKFYHLPTPWLPQGRYVLVTEQGKVLWESPAGLVYKDLPVLMFSPELQTDCLMGYSPSNDLVGLAEAVNSLVSAIQSNAANYGNQYVAVSAGTDLNPRTLGEGQKILEVPAGMPFPQGINLTAIPPALYEHLANLMKYMEQLPAISNSSRGQTGGANQTGAAMLFLSSQTTQNQGNISAAYADFSAAVQTQLLHLLRVFGKTEQTIQLMGQTNSGRNIVMSDALKDFDEVVVDLSNPILNTPSGRLGFASQMMQFGNATPAQALQVATSGQIGPVTDPVRQEMDYLQYENEWLLGGENVLVLATDDHSQHVQYHKGLFNQPWLRKPDLAEKLGITNAPQIMNIIQQHILSHMAYLGGNTANAVQATAGVQPGQPTPGMSAMMGHPDGGGGGPPNGGGGPPAPPGGPGAPPHAQPPPGGAAQAAKQAHVQMPAQPSMPQMPHAQQSGTAA
jgi:hypothetical protein